MGNFTFSHPGLELLPQLLARGRWLTMARTGIALHRRGTAIESIAAQILRPLIPSPAWALIDRLRGRRLALADHSALHPDLAAEVPAARAPGIWRTREMRAAMVQASEYGNFRQGALAGWGLDVRDPTSDRRLIELCLSIPADQYVAGGVPRSLARRALADRLPAAVAGETKKGFQGADWHLGVLGAWDSIREELGRIGTVPAARRLLDMDRLESLVNGSRERDWNSYDSQAHYRLALLRSLSAGHFLRSAAAGG
jgi:asparagine synthase (glutamine-hydrolysing)